MPRTRLIVNADDLGNGAATDRGIFAAFVNGIVTSASLLVNGPSWREAAQKAADKGLPLGLHLNLSEGLAINGPLAGLTDATGRFLGKTAARKALASGQIESTVIANEFLAQIEQARAAGVNPDHLDTHQHCALFPIVTTALISTAQTSGIMRCRLPLSQEPAENTPPELAGELHLYRSLAPALGVALRRARCATPQGLYGMPALNRLDEAYLFSLLNHLPAGDWELMVHPGYRSTTHSFATVAREHELAALTAPEIQAAVTQRGIKLITFAELPCAC